MRYRTKAWLGLVGYTVTVEILAPPGELLSEAFDDWLTKPATKVAAVAVVAATAGHLLNAIPPKYDIYHQVGRIASWVGDCKSEFACGLALLDSLPRWRRVTVAAPVLTHTTNRPLAVGDW
jgi:hypothetical protein